MAGLEGLAKRESGTRWQPRRRCSLELGMSGLFRLLAKQGSGLNPALQCWVRRRKTIRYRRERPRLLSSLRNWVLRDASLPVLRCWAIFKNHRRPIGPATGSAQGLKSKRASFFSASARWGNLGQRLKTISPADFSARRVRMLGLVCPAGNRLMRAN